MSICIITGSSGLVGSEAVRFFADKFDKVIGIDNNMRQYFFNAPTKETGQQLEEIKNFENLDIDIRNYEELESVFNDFREDVKLIIHAAAQPSHDWAAKEPLTDFSVNALGTLHLLELTRLYCPDAVFIYVSTNKVYGDRINYWPKEPVSEDASIDTTMHSLFGCSKLAGDIYAQEYGQYFEMKTGVFRCGCITGKNHQGAEQHGFLAYLVKCIKDGIPYTIYGHGGAQVRDNIHAYDLANAFWHFYQKPRAGAVFNMGGGRDRAKSLVKYIELIEAKTGKKGVYHFGPARKGDHEWWITNVTEFRMYYPYWSHKYDLNAILDDLIN